MPDLRQLVRELMREQGWVKRLRPLQLPVVVLLAQRVLRQGLGDGTLSQWWDAEPHRREWTGSLKEGLGEWIFEHLVYHKNRHR